MHWQRPFIDADGLFTPGTSIQTYSRIPTMWVLPQHLLEAPYLSDKASLFSLPYWREAFIGAGPFRMAEWVEGSHALLVANPTYPLGRPHLDRVEVRFFSDVAAL